MDDRLLGPSGSSRRGDRALRDSFRFSFIGAGETPGEGSSEAGDWSPRARQPRYRW